MCGTQRPPGIQLNPIYQMLTYTSPKPIPRVWAIYCNWKSINATKAVTPGDKWSHGKLEFMLSQRGKPLLVHDGHSFGIQYIRKDKKYWQCNLSRKFNCKARVTTTDTGEIIVTNNEHCHTEIRQHLKKDYKSKMLANSSASSSHQSGSTDFNSPSTNWNWWPWRRWSGGWSDSAWQCLTKPIAY